MVYLMYNICSPEGSSTQETNRNLPEKKEVQDDKDEKENWRKKLCLPKQLGINVVHWY